MTYAKVAIAEVEKRAREIIADIGKERSSLKAANDAPRKWWQSKAYDEISILCYRGSQEAACERLLDLCEIAQSAGETHINLSAKDASLIA